MFVIQLIAFRLGSARLAKIGMGQRHIHVAGHGGHVGEQDAPSSSMSMTPATNGSPVTSIDKEKLALNDSSSVLDDGYMDASEQNPMIAQVMGVATLEFGAFSFSSRRGSLFFPKRD